MESGPIPHVLHGVVGSIVPTPSLDTQEVASIIEVALEKELDRLVLASQQLPLQKGPSRGCHRGVDGYGGGL